MAILTTLPNARSKNATLDLAVELPWMESEDRTNMSLTSEIAGSELAESDSRTVKATETQDALLHAIEASQVRP
jgi:hypothetical protein